MFMDKKMSRMNMETGAYAVIVKGIHFKQDQEGNQKYFCQLEGEGIRYETVT